MTARKTELSRKERSDIRTLMRFTSIFCRENHKGQGKPFTFTGFDMEGLGAKDACLCPDCTRLIRYALAKRLRCPHDPKPMCKQCVTPCHGGEYREKIRAVMRFSGLYLIKHGRVDLLYHYFR